MDCKRNHPWKHLLLSICVLSCFLSRSIRSDNNLHLLIGMHQAGNKLLISELFLNSEHDLQLK